MEVFSKKMFLLGNDNIGDEVALQLEKETPVLESTSPTLIWIPYNVQSRPNKQGCDSPMIVLPA